MSEIAQGPGRVPQFVLTDRLRKAREDVGMSQAALADASGLSRSSISNYEAGRQVPRRPQITLIAWATGVDRDWLERGDMGMPRPGGPAGASSECAIKDSNLEPTDYEHRVIELRRPKGDDAGAAA